MEKTFTNENYKKSNGFKKFVNISYISSMDDMKNEIIIFLPNFKINFFGNDPNSQDYSKNIRTFISGYETKKIFERKK